jgi:hypothetical protein
MVGQFDYTYDSAIKLAVYDHLPSGVSGCYQECLSVHSFITFVSLLLFLLPVSCLIGVVQALFGRAYCGVHSDH